MSELKRYPLIPTPELISQQMSSPWEVRISNSRKVHYFFNTQTKQSAWDPPSDLTQDQISRLPGAHLIGSATREVAPPLGSVRASHLLVKHEDSRRPASWKEANITRTQDEAIEILKGYQWQINGNPETFAALAK